MYKYVLCKKKLLPNFPVLCNDLLREQRQVNKDKLTNEYSKLCGTLQYVYKFYTKEHVIAI